MSFYQSHYFIYRHLIFVRTVENTKYCVERRIALKSCYQEIKLLAAETYLEPYQTSQMEGFRIKLFLEYAPSQMFDRVFNKPLSCIASTHTFPNWCPYLWINLVFSKFAGWSFQLQQKCFLLVILKDCSNLLVNSYQCVLYTKFILHQSLAVVLSPWVLTEPFIREGSAK